MSNESKRLNVSILGKNFVISTNENEDEIQMAALMVDEMVKEKLPKVAMLNNKNEKALIIISLQLAIDLLKNKQILDRYESEVCQVTQLLNEQLN
jgi:cell division protein ZapA (FtsZ GTPase activity inhibitor)